MRRRRSATNVVSAEILEVREVLATFTGAGFGVFDHSRPNDAAVTGVGSSFFTWGKPGDGVNSNEFAFTSRSFAVNANQLFSVGYLSYENANTGVNDATDVDLVVILNLTSGPSSPVFYKLGMLTVPDVQGNPDAGADYVYLDRSAGSIATVTVGRQTYLLEILGFANWTPQNGYQFISQFRVHEYQSANAELVARFTAISDFSVTEVKAPSSAVTNSTISVTTDVWNVGSLASGKYSVDYYLSRVVDGRAENIPLKTISRPSLTPNSHSRWSESVKLPNSVSVGDYFVLVAVNRSKGVAELNYDNNGKITPLSITLKPDPFENDDTPTKVKKEIKTDGTPEVHSIHVGTDVDWVKFTIKQTSNVTIETHGSAGDTRIYLYRSDAATLIDEDNDDGSGRFSLIVRSGSKALAAGTYYVKVDEYDQNDVIVNYAISVNATKTDKVQATVLRPSAIQTSKSPERITPYLKRIDPEGAPIQSDRRTWVVIHGRAATFQGQLKDSGKLLMDLAVEIGKHVPDPATDQVLVLDWKGGADDNQSKLFGEKMGLQGAGWIPGVAEAAKGLLTSLGISAHQLFLVGHSWGSFVAYEIANRFGEVGGIVALDPASGAAGGYVQSQVDFKEVSKVSWAFYGGGTYGSAPLSGKADTAVTMIYHNASPSVGEQHQAPVELFTEITRQNNLTSSIIGHNFRLDRLISPTSNPDPWRQDEFNLIGGLGSVVGDVFEVVFEVRDRGGQVWNFIHRVRYIAKDGSPVSLP